MKKLCCFLLAMLLFASVCFTGCTMTEAAVREPEDYTEPTEPETAAPTAAEPFDAGISSVVMECPAEITVTPDAPAELPIRFTNVDDNGAPVGGRICTLTVQRRGETVMNERVFALHEGTELTLPLDYSFSRYDPDREELLTLLLTYEDERVVARVNVRLQNWPDEVYAEMTGEKLPYSIDILRNENLVVVYGLDEDGAYTQPVHVFLCSTGKATPSGNYKIGWKVPWRALFGYVYGQYAMHINGNILFHSVPYKRMAKDTLKSAEFNKLGTAASMGCIRMAVADVKWIYDYCPSGTAVHIFDVDELTFEKPEQILLDLEDERACWDPTDPDPENPWNS